MEKLTPHQTKALELAFASSAENLNLSKLEWYFVDKLPWQPPGSDNKFIAKIWGENKIYVDKYYWPNLATMLTKAEGRRIICHETVHQVQIARWGWTQFMIRYAWGYVKAGFSYRNNALEREAYSREYVLLNKFEEYLKGGK